MISLLTAKPVLIGLHLGFAIVGIDAFFWLLGELFAKSENSKRMKWAAGIGTAGFFISWLAGGYYYLTFYGAVRDAIKAGTAPWAHLVFMETKEHIFLFLPVLALTVLWAVWLGKDGIEQYKLGGPLKVLVGVIIALGLAIGLMGYIISAAARWAT
jgi:hypothetical protein